MWVSKKAIHVKKEKKYWEGWSLGVGKSNEISLVLFIVMCLVAAAVVGVLKNFYITWMLSWVT